MPSSKARWFLQSSCKGLVDFVMWFTDNQICLPLLDIREHIGLCVANLRVQYSMSLSTNQYILMLGILCLEFARPPSD